MRTHPKSWNSDLRATPLDGVPTSTLPFGSYLPGSKMAAGLGFEPRLMDSKSTVLPLHNPAERSKSQDVDTLYHAPFAHSKYSRERRKKHKRFAANVFQAPQSTQRNVPTVAASRPWRISIRICHFLVPGNPLYRICAILQQPEKKALAACCCGFWWGLGMAKLSPGPYHVV